MQATAVQEEINHCHAEMLKLWYDQLGTVTVTQQQLTEAHQVK